jgi:hypothetical protein
MEFQGATREFMRNPAVAEKVKVKFILKSLERYFPRMAQTLQNERETLESQNQRPDHTWAFRRLQELKGGWLVQSPGKFGETWFNYVHQWGQ